MKMDKGAGAGAMNMADMKPPAPHPSVPVMAAISFVVLAAGLLIAWIFGGLS
jgi:hypothetical protein